MGAVAQSNPNLQLTHSMSAEHASASSMGDLKKKYPLVVTVIGALCALVGNCTHRKMAYSIKMHSWGRNLYPFSACRDNGLFTQQDSSNLACSPVVTVPRYFTDTIVVGVDAKLFQYEV